MQAPANRTDTLKTHETYILAFENTVLCFSGKVPGVQNMLIGQTKHFQQRCNFLMGVQQCVDRICWAYLWCTHSLEKFEAVG